MTIQLCFVTGTRRQILVHRISQVALITLIFRQFGPTIK